MGREKKRSFKEQLADINKQILDIALECKPNRNWGCPVYGDYRLETLKIKKKSLIQKQLTKREKQAYKLRKLLKEE